MKQSPVGGSAEEGGCVVCTDGQTGGIATSSSCRILMIETELLFSLCYFYPYLSCSSYLQHGSGGVCGSCRLTPRMDLGFGRSIAALFGPLQQISGVGVLENALPLGNNTTTHSFQMPPTHMCTFFSVISANRNWLRLEEMAFYEAKSTGMGSFSN